MSNTGNDTAPRQAQGVARGAFIAAVISTIGIVTLIWSEIWLTLAASIWSFVELLGVGLPGYIVLSAVLAPLAIWASWHTARLAWIGESRGNL